MGQLGANELLISLAVRLVLTLRHPLFANASTTALPSSSTMCADAPAAVKIVNSTSGSEGKPASGGTTRKPCTSCVCATGVTAKPACAAAQRPAPLEHTSAIR